MEEHDNHFVSLNTERVITERIKALFEGLPEREVRTMLEELFDDYAYAQYGTSVLHEMRKLKFNTKSKSICIQTLAKGRAMLVSNHGFKVVSESQCKCGKAFLVLDELNRQDMERER